MRKGAHGLDRVGSAGLDSKVPVSLAPLSSQPSRPQGSPDPRPAAVPDLRALFAEGDRRNRRVGALVELVAALERATDLTSRLDALEALFTWIKQRDNGVPLPVGEVGAPAELRRLIVVLALCEKAPALREILGRTLGHVLAETEGLPLFAEAGLPNDRGIVDETADRIARRLLPRPRDEHQLSRLLGRLFPRERDVAWLDGVPPDVFARLHEILGGEDAAEPLVVSMGEAMGLIAARVQTLGLSEAMRARQRSAPLRQSPFFRLPRSTDALLENLHVPATAIDAERAFRADVAACREATTEVLAELENTGVSVDVVYSIDVITRSLERMELLLSVLKAAPGPERSVATHRLLAALAKARLQDRSLRELARENLRLLARKIVERAGRTGEHYITSSRAEWFGMLASAAGGGVLTAGTAALKISVAAAHFPLFVEGALSGLNYSVSFIAILMFGFTLATKQPSMTAAALAGAMHESRGGSRIEDVASLIVRTIRSQLAAATGNVGVVAVTAVAFDLFWRWRTGAAFMVLEKADATLASFHPLRSGTIFYASLTGVILWLSSIIGGWCENFTVYRRLPQAISEHRWGRVLGRGFMAAVARFVARNASGYGGSIALGFMLGMTPVFGKFFGLPIDVRHVTLSTGTLALAGVTLGKPVLMDPRLWWAAAGIGVIFVCNLGVSFLLALTVAMRARSVSSHDRALIFKAVVRRFFRNPGAFFLPPKAGEPPGASRGH